MDGSLLPHDECPMAVALREGRAVRGAEAIVERPDGSRATFVPYPTPLRDAEGRLVGGVNVLIDVTERQRAVDELRSTAEALRESNAVKDEFLGLVSHELRTPVTTIFGNARLLATRGEQLDGESRRSMVADIAADSDRLLGIVENLLLLTRIGTGAGASLDLEPQAIGHIVARTLHGYRGRHRSRPISLRSERQHIVVEADRTYLELVVENLISNADKYSPEGTEIEVVVELVGAEAHVLVLDRGIGVGEDEADRLFAPFYRADSARAKASGLGIGLAVCRRLVEAQRGRMWARPRAGGGSEFGFALPLAPEPDDSPASV
jgi:K+-sensing histidine kinase KdpD